MYNLPKRVTVMNRVNRTYQQVITALAVGYILAVSFYMLSHRAWFSPDQFFAVAIIAALILGRAKDFLTDWIPVLLLLFGYEYLRGLGPVLTDKPNIHLLINADNFLFGGNVTVSLQSMLTHPDRLYWYDYLTTVIYISHFFIPWFVAFLFWVRNRTYFRLYTTGFLILSYAAFITYMLFPAMPPWMASAEGYLPPLTKIMDRVLSTFAHPIDIPSVYRFFGANLVAPMPSVHAAYPTIIFFYIRRFFPRLTFLSALYMFGVFFTVVYLGEHYVIDVIAGALYALFGYRIAKVLEPVILISPQNAEQVATTSLSYKNMPKPGDRKKR